MFDTLLESKPKRQRSWGQAFLSLVMHGILIFAAVKVTQSVAEAPRERPADTKMVFLKPPEPAPEKPRAAAAPPPPAAAVVNPNPPPKGFKTIVPPTDIPKEIPPIDFNEKPFDPKDYSAIGQEGGDAKGVIGGTGPVGEGGAAGSGLGSGTVFSSGDLDDPVQIISISEPRFPAALRSLGIEGTVDLKYVVDTTGHAEPNSFEITSSSRPEFVSPAKEAILKAVFKPARFRSRPVRQLVQQRVKFQITGR